MATAGQLEALPQWDLRRIAWVDPRPGLGPAQRGHPPTETEALQPVSFTSSVVIVTVPLGAGPALVTVKVTVMVLVPSLPLVDCM